jgi:WhiB family redox-sensing transcriptional regulator
MERIGNGVPQDQEAVPVTTTLQERQRSEDGEETSTNSTTTTEQVAKGIGKAGLTEDDFLEKGWQDLANCLGVDPDLFFPERGASTREAKEVCKGCSVRAECLEYALSNGERFGIWGGLSERERRRLRRQRVMFMRSELSSDPPES